jgi:hypothetical protein
MRVNPTVKALQNSVLKGAAGKRPAEALSRSVETAAMVSSSAAEFLRVRRDPAEVAIRRRRAAVRRRNIWGAGVVVGVAGGAALTVGIVHGGVTASAIFSLVLVTALVTWCIVGLVKAAADLRRRNRAVAALPPPQPARRPVATPIRADIARLDSYSDGLRQLVSMLPAGSPEALSLRRDVIVSADGAELLLRRQAQEYTGVRKTSAGAPAGARPGLDSTAAGLAERIRTGVAQYGSLVAAATETIVATAHLDRTLVDLREPTERLQALAMGMREIAEHARPGGPTG